MGIGEQYELEKTGRIAPEVKPPKPSLGTWKLLHRGDPCVLCQKPASEAAPAGCPVTAQQLWSRIGHLVDEASAAWEAARTSKDAVEARRLAEEAKRLQRIHSVLTKDMAPAGEAS